MKELRLKAFVLRAVPYGENRRLLELLGEDGTLYTITVGDRDKRISKALTQNFVLGEFELFPSGSRYKPRGGRLIHAFLELQEDWDRLTAAAHLAEVFADALRMQDRLPAAYSLFAYSLQQLCTGEDPMRDVRIAQFRLLSEMGFSPWLQDCVRCHVEIPKRGYFSHLDGGVLCDRDAARHPSGRELQSLNPDSRACMIYLMTCPVERLFSIRISDLVRSEVIALTDLWCRWVMEKDYRRLELSEELDQFAKFLQKESGEKS